MMDLTRLPLLGLLGMAGLAAGGGGLAWWLAPAAPGPTSAPASAPVSAPVAASPPAAGPPRTSPMAAATAEAPPRFDIARIGARGTAVVAGRAAPGAEVSLQDGERELGRARADARGEWVILPAEPLASGPHELSLTARTAEGGTRKGDETLLVLVPDAAPAIAATGAAPGASLGAAGGPPGPVAVLLPRMEAAHGGAAHGGVVQPPRLLQAAAPPAATARAAPQVLALDVVDYDEEGGLRFAGSAPAGSHLRLYIDQAHAGDARAGPEGRWAMRPEASPAPGLHTLRLDQLGPQGRVTARLELPFQRDRVAPAEGRIVVQPGHNLWRIARATYGRGTRYTLIYRANQEQIRDPGRIYPGQVFSLPPS